MQPSEYTFDPARLAALASYDVLDTPAEPEFDGIVRLATLICQTPVALVSLVAVDRQWFKARVGFAPCQTDLNSSVCAHALIEPDLLIIPDLTKDERSRDNPLVVGEPHIRFYAGAPFRAASGEVLGSLCVIDTLPRPQGLTAAQAEALRTLAQQVTSLLEMRKAIVERDALSRQRLEAERRRQGLLLIGERLRDVSSATEMTEIAASTVGQVLNANRVGFTRLDDKGHYIAGDPDWTFAKAPEDLKYARMSDHIALWERLLHGEPLVIADVVTDPRTRDNSAALTDLGVRSLVDMPVRQNGRTVAVMFVHDREPREWPPETLVFLRNVADRLELGVARLKSEAAQRILNEELGHRLKNTFAMIQAIATQTLRSIPEKGPVEAFVQRLHALSTAHDVLLEQKWATAEIDEVVKNVIGAIAERARFGFSGPSLALGPRATLSLSLLLHELTTNAVKYGALSNQTGQVKVAWRLVGEGEAKELALDWRELGGPPVESPKRKGFGSKLIQMGLMGTGGVDLRYDESGFTADFRAPLTQVQGS